MANASNKPSWRRKAGSKPVASTEKGWQAKRASAAGAAATGHRLKLGLLGLLVVALGAAFIIFAWRRPMATPLIVVSTTSYASQIPPNDYAQEDVESLTVANPKNVQLTEVLSGNVDKQVLVDHLDKQLKNIWPGGPGKDTALIYVSAHGAIDGEGNPCLLLSDSHPLDATTWLQMGELLDHCKPPPGIKIVLLLDTTRLDSVWELGLLENGFIEQLEKLLAEKPIADLFVFTASSAGERAWSAPEVSGSIFGHYVARGLQGAASTDDKEITLREFVGYVSREVARHATGQRASHQTPRMLSPLTAEQDFPIAYIAGSSATAMESSSANAAIDAVPKNVHDYWQQLEDNVLDRRARRYEPVRVARAEQALLRLEQLHLAGKAYAKEYSEVESRVREVLEDFNSDRLFAGIDTFSLPLNQQLAGRTTSDPEIVATLGRWRASDGKPPVKKEDPPPPPLEYFQAAAVAWSFLSQHERPRRIHVHDLLELLDASKPPRNQKGEQLPDLVEIHFLRMLEQHLDDSSAKEFPENHVAAIAQSLAGRTLAEQAAAPDDARVHYWSHGLVNSADKDRRLAEDALFFDASSATTNSAGVHLKNYEQAVQRAKAIGDALALRDEIWHGLPHLAAWVLRSGSLATIGDRGETPETLLAQVQILTSGNHELASTLDRMLVDGQIDDVKALQTLAKDLTAAWESLHGSFSEYCQDLKERGTNDRMTFKEIGEVLRVPSPLVSAAERKRLAAEYFTLAFQRTQIAGGGGSSENQEGANDDSTTAATVASELAKLDPHPAIQILDRSQFTMLLRLGNPEAVLQRGDASDILWLARQGERVRSRLANLQTVSSSLEDDTKDRLKEARETAANTRAGASESDRLVRAGAAFLHGGDPFEPALQLEKVDRYFQMLWHTHRTLEDFWGPAKRGAQPGESYFVQAAAGYLAAARQFDETPTSFRYGSTNLRDLLTARLAAAQGIQVQPGDIRTLSDTETENQKISVTWPANLPVPGFAGLWIETASRNGTRATVPGLDKDGRASRRQSLEVSGSSNVQLTRRMPTEPLATASDRKATLLYRGHVVSQPFNVRRPEAILLASHDPALPPTAKVTVTGEGSRRAFITFILDCSYSMTAVDDNVPRMSAAKSALQQVLSALRTGSNYHVCLRAFSHRYKYTSEKIAIGRDKMRTNGNPDKDVEVVVEMDKLTPDHFQRLNQEISNLSPFGVTPLYYSLVDTLSGDDFKFAQPGDSKHIVVITDGINQNYVDFTTADAVLAELAAQHEVRIDVVLFQEQAVLRNPTGQLTVEGIRRELADIKEIAERSGGHYFSANDPGQLATSLREALKLVKFSVTPEGTSPVPPSEQKEFGETQAIDISDGRPGKYQVQLHPQLDVEAPIVEIEGGEALELEYDKGRDRLVFRPYERAQRDGRPLEGDFVDPVSQESYQVTPILPYKTLDRVLFEIAIQNIDLAKFTARPKNVWVEIQPRNANRDPVGKAYCFYDAQFARDTPVPVFQFVAEKWPKGATLAAVQMWFKYSNPPIKANGSAPVRSLEPVIIDEDIPDVQFRAELTQPGQGSRDWRVRVIERHVPGTPLFTTRVQAQPTPFRISHRYFIGVDEAHHEFDYRGEASPVVLVTARDRIRDQAIAVPQFELEIKEGSM